MFRVTFSNHFEKDCKHVQSLINHMSLPWPEVNPSLMGVAHNSRFVNFTDFQNSSYPPLQFNMTFIFSLLKFAKLFRVSVHPATVNIMALESEAAFRARALQVGISSDDLDQLKAGGISSFSRYAFCSAFQPGSGNEDVLFNHLETILGVKPTGADASNYRRLFFESHALALKDLQSILDRSDTSEIKILPLAEKVQRLEALKQKFPGIMLSTSMEPSHELIDRIVHQYEENCVKLVELSKCTSREQEIKSERSSSQLSFYAQGNIKISKQSAVSECSISGEIKLRAAFTRRSLAYDLANVASFEVMESWSQLLFDRVCQDPPAGYRHISTDQIIQADKKLWVKVAEKTRSKVTGTNAAGVKNVDLAIQELSHHPDVQFYMLPLPLRDGASSSSGQRFEPYPQNRPSTGDQKGKGKSGGKSQGKEGKGRIQIPDGCAIKFGENKNKPICMKFNVGACRANIKAGKRCMHGYHVCWKVNCNRPFPYHECSHVGSA